MKTPIEQVLDWLWLQAPGIAVLIIVFSAGAWLAIKINNFSNRFAVTEQLCNDINNRQLPEIRTELKEINVRLSKIELSLNTIITYLSTRSGSSTFRKSKHEN